MNWDLRDIYRRLTPEDVDNPLLAALLAVARWGMVFYLQLERDQAFVRAAQMAYQTLVALVPMLLLIFGLLSATGALPNDPSEFESLIFETLIADIPQIREFIMSGVAALDFKALGIIGVVGLIIFAGRLYVMVESAYNHIFGTEKRRNWIVRLLSFWFAITVIPALVATGVLSGIQYADEMNSGLEVRTFADPILMFTLLFAALKLFPTVTVRWGPALLGAGVSTVGIVAARELFRLYLAWFRTDDPLVVVYGTVGLIPVFLLWLYLLWVLILLGVEVAFVFQNFHSLWEAETSNLERRDKPLRGPQLHTALEAMAWIGWHFEEGNGPVDGEEVARRIGLTSRQLTPVLSVLESHGFLQSTPTGWTLQKPTHAIPLSTIVDVWQEETSSTAAATATTRAAADVANGMVRALPPTLEDAIDRWVVPDVEIHRGTPMPAPRTSGDRPPSAE